MVNKPSIFLKSFMMSSNVFCEDLFLRDILNEGFNSIQVNDKDLYLELKDYLASVSPEQEKILKQYDVQISMNGKGRSIDNIVIEIFLRTLKYNCIL